MNRTLLIVLLTLISPIVGFSGYTYLLRFYSKYTHFVTTLRKWRSRIVLAIAHSLTTALSYLIAEFASKRLFPPMTSRNTTFGLVLVIAGSGIGAYIGETVAIYLLKKGEVKES